jgi:hypothetical protein
MKNVMGKKPKRPPPRATKEDRRFRSLLQKLVAVPIEEVHAKRKEHQRRRKQPHKSG